MISVLGQGRATGAPDVMRARLAATALRPSVAEAMAGAQTAVEQIRAVLGEAGVARVDMATAGISVNAEQVWHETTGPRITGYRADHELALTLRDLGTAGAVLGRALAAAGDDVRLSWVGFEIEDSTALRVRARELAWADARDRASQLAALAGCGLGPVVSISEDVAPPSLPLPGVRMAMAGKEAAFDVAPGGVEVGVALAVSWQVA